MKLLRPVRRKSHLARGRWTCHARKSFSTGGPIEEGNDKAFTRSSIYGLGPPDMTYGGALSFMRRKYTKDLTGVQLAVSGVPFDNAVTNRPGARLGPRGVRAASTQIAELKSFPWGLDVFADFSVVDYGDCYLNPHQPETIVPAIRQHAQRILANNTQMLTFGGDHFISYPLIAAHVKHLNRPLSLIHFDAHCDTWPDGEDYSGPSSPPLRIDHGTMFYRAVKEGLILPQQSVQIGLRTWNDDTLGFNILDSPFVHEQGVLGCRDRLLQVFAAGLPPNAPLPVYLTFDIDCLDPAFAPGTGTPVPGGLSTAQALQLLRLLISDPQLSRAVYLVGADVVEVSPPFDMSELTALAAAHIAYELIHIFRHHHLLRAKNTTAQYH